MQIASIHFLLGPPAGGWHRGIDRAQIPDRKRTTLPSKTRPQTDRAETL